MRVQLGILRFISETKRRMGGSVLTGLVVLAATITPAFAACDGYAASAVQQTQEYRKLGCAGGDPSWWNDNPAYHRNWCLSLPAGSFAPGNGRAMRDGVLQRCRLAQSRSGGAAASTGCDGYADSAVRQTLEYRNLRCTGGQSNWWSDNRDYHRNWCIGLPAGSTLANDGSASREQVLKQCRQTARAGGAQPGVPGAMGQHPKQEVFTATICDNWDVTLAHGGVTYRSRWSRAQGGSCYGAVWTAQGQQSFRRNVCPLNARLDFWADEADGSLRYYYRNDLSQDFGTARMHGIGGRWEGVTPNGSTRLEGRWKAVCTDPSR